MVFCGPTKMPFSNQATDIARLSQFVSDRFLTDRQSRIGVFVLGSNRIELVTKPSLIPPRQNTRSRCTAKRGRHVALSKTNSAGRNRIDVRRRDLIVPLATKFAIAQIVRHNNDDIRLLSCVSLMRKTYANPSQTDDDQERTTKRTSTPNAVFYTNNQITHLQVAVSTLPIPFQLGLSPLRLPLPQPTPLVSQYLDQSKFSILLIWRNRLF